MKQELESLEEHRDVIEKASHAIFVRKSKSDTRLGQLQDFIKGDTPEMANFIDQFKLTNNGNRKSIDNGLEMVS